MFTDVKNLPANQILDRPIKLPSTHKAKGRFHKLFKPLFRMLRTSKMTSHSGAVSIAHPNNINLNNCMDLSLIPPTVFEALTQAAYEDYAVVIRKVAKDEDFLQSYFAEDPFGDTTPYALDCTTLKSQPPSACGCSHGFNCQQYYGEHKKYSNNCPILVSAEPSDESLVPVHYVRTHNGTFFWTTEPAKLDEDLMKPMDCNSYRQPAQAQCDNSALLY